MNGRGSAVSLLGRGTPRAIAAIANAHQPAGVGTIRDLGTVRTWFLVVLMVFEAFMAAGLIWIVAWLEQPALQLRARDWDFGQVAGDAETRIGFGGVTV